MLGIGEVALRLNRSAKTIRRWEKGGLIHPAVRIGKDRFWTESDVQKLVEAATELDLLEHQIHSQGRGRRLRTLVGTRSGGRIEDLRRLEDQLEVPPKPRWAIPEPKVRNWSRIEGKIDLLNQELLTACPTCGARLSDYGATNATGAYIVSRCCDRHGRVGLLLQRDAEQPKASAAPTCPECHGELIWEATGIRGATAELAMMAVCDRCGPVEVADQQVEVRAENWGDGFDLHGSWKYTNPPDSKRRRRGEPMSPATITRMGLGAVRAPKPPPKPDLKMLAPFELPGR